MEPSLPASWQPVVGEELTKPYFTTLWQFVEEERQHHKVYPSAAETFNALTSTAYPDTKVLILGQDPYHGPGQAHGLSFSVRPGTAIPPSLKNIYRELQEDLGITPPQHGHLQAWAERGVLLLNAVLTVKAGAPNSHQGKGWELFTDAVITAVAAKPERVVFLFWGSYARKKRRLIASEQHVVLESAHPSPLSAHRGFFGSRPFSKTNHALVEAGLEPIDWQLPAPSSLS